MPSPAEAAAEILRRDAACESLAVFALERGFWPARHHLHLIDRLEAVARGDIKRLMVFMPPGSAKSTYTSQLFPAWLAAQPFLSGRTGWDILATSNTSTLAEEFSLKVRRHARESEKMLGYELSGESQAVGRWEIKGRAVYRCAGAGAAIAGQRADVALIDDPIKGSEEADSETQRAKIWRWYTDDLRQRVKPEGAVIVVQCMTGDTPVMLADGTERALSDIAAGDLVATYDDGNLCASRVIAWRSQGDDDIHEITTRSGVRLKANERHPFLTVREGVTEWKRLRDLRPGDCLVRRRSGADGRGPRVLPMAASYQQSAEGSALPTTTRPGGPLASGLHRATLNASGQPTSSTDTVLPVPSMTNFSPSRADGARSADVSRTSPSRRIGAEGSASTIATTREPSVDCSATTATCGSDAGQPSRSLKPAWSTCDFTEDEIVDIRPAGRAEVFDLQVEGTENFLASGIVSHNTRWHEDDLSGRILPASWDGESGRIKGRDGEWWEVVCLPQLASRDDDPLGRADGQALWPEWMPQEACERMRDGMTPRSWSALHQQRPSPDTGGFFDRRWFGRYTFVPQGVRAFMASDWATPEGTDWTVHVVVTVDASNRLYVTDVWRGRGTTAESIDAALDLCARHKCSAWLNEKGVLWRTISGQAQARMRERNVFCPNEEYARTQAKDVMARAIQGRWSQGMVMLPEQAPWLADLEHELLRFPAGRHDDQVDALALIGLHLDKVVAPPKQSFGMVKAPEDRMWS